MTLACATAMPYRYACQQTESSVVVVAVADDVATVSIQIGLRLLGLLELGRAVPDTHQHRHDSKAQGMSRRWDLASNVFSVCSTDNTRCTGRSIDAASAQETPKGLREHHREAQKDDRQGH